MAGGIFFQIRRTAGSSSPGPPHHIRLRVFLESQTLFSLFCFVLLFGVKLSSTQGLFLAALGGPYGMSDIEQGWVGWGGDACKANALSTLLYIAPAQQTHFLQTTDRSASPLADLDSAKPQNGCLGTHERKWTTGAAGPPHGEKLKELERVWGVGMADTCLASSPATISEPRALLGVAQIFPQRKKKKVANSGGDRAG